VVFFCAPLLLSCHRAEPSAQASPAPARSPSASAAPSAPVPPAAASAAASASAAFSASASVSAPAAASDAPRVYSKTRFVWIRQAPDSSTQWIGYLWTGESAELFTGRPVYGPGCMNWYAVKPLGYVCVDGLRATLDRNDPGYLAVEKYAADLGSPWPHQYGEAQKLTRLHALQGSPLRFPGLPNSIHDQRTELRRGSTVAFLADPLHVGDRDWLLGSDLSYIPKEKVTPFPHYEFHGIDLKGDDKLPLALFRSEAHKLRRDADGFSDTGQTFARLSHVALTGQSQETDGERYLETEAGAWVKAKEAVAPAPSGKPPWGTRTPQGRATWIEVSVTQGWLIAYEGDTPVFTTLVSPGRGGPAKPDQDPIEEARTPLGTFPISGKFATATMEAPGNLVHSAVPWTQNFSGPHAMHAAYWHDNWGNYQSGGCINLSPLDGKKLFEWTEPALPAGWHGVRWLPWRGPATIMVVHR
jgi:hypothetical protein